MGSPPPELSLADWAVLGIVAEHPTHGWPVVRALRADGEIGRVWTVPRAVVYRSLATLTARGMLEERGEADGVRGPQRTILGITPRGRAALRRWFDTPVQHVRDVRSELLVKLALLARAGRDPTPLLERQLTALAPVIDAVSTRPARSGFDLVLARWRREQALAVDRFLRASLAASLGVEPPD